MCQAQCGKEEVGEVTERERRGLVTDPKPINSKLKKSISFIYLYIYIYMPSRKKKQVRYLDKDRK